MDKLVESSKVFLIYFGYSEKYLVLSEDLHITKIFGNLQVFSKSCNLFTSCIHGHIKKPVLMGWNIENFTLLHATSLYVGTWYSQRIIQIIYNWRREKNSKWPQNFFEKNYTPLNINNSAELPIHSTNLSMYISIPHRCICFANRLWNHREIWMINWYIHALIRKFRLTEMKISHKNLNELTLKL